MPVSSDGNPTPANGPAAPPGELALHRRASFALHRRASFALHRRASFALHRRASFARCPCRTAWKAYDWTWR